jgi:oligopeptide/dipeptide ABC transporter ATP-binding protein
MFPLRRGLQIVFQDPYGSLNPRLSVADAVAEGLGIHRLATRAEILARVERLLAEVGLDPRDAGRYPHEFSGGQRQRIGIARALAVEPELVVCDEPVSALDVSVQAQVLNLLADLRRDRNLALLFIAHDLAVVRQVAQRIAVMYLGRIVEEGPAATIVSAPRHPYAQALLSAVPSPDPNRRTTRIVLAGDPPSPSVPMPGCALVSRCFHPHRDSRCLAERPALRAVGGHQVACHHPEES